MHRQASGLQTRIAENMLADDRGMNRSPGQLASRRSIRTGASGRLLVRRERLRQMTDPVLCPGALWNRMLPSLARLPDGQLTRDVLVSSEFLLAEEDRLAVYWIPFERLNPGAAVVLLGLTPGYGQMREAFVAARDALREGKAVGEILSDVDRRASFAGTMRTNMIRMLDSIGLAEALGIASTADLFGADEGLVHTTSALRYPVFVDGRNYGGTNPTVPRSELLQGYVRELLGPELVAVPDALIVPLGKAVETCLGLLVSDGSLQAHRCLFGFPHPSGGNGHRKRQFRENRERLTQEILDWAATLPSRAAQAS